VPPDNQENAPDPNCDLDYTPHEARRRDVPVAMSNSFGFAGHNASLVAGRLRNGAATY
jgi:3-oxoacyl-[acyl-carrier-protein] synthase II